MKKEAFLTFGNVYPELVCVENTQKVGPLRLNRSCFDKDGSTKRLVTHFKMVNGFPFFVLEGLDISEKSSLKLLPGCYGFQVPSDYHKYRSLWAEQNTLIGSPEKVSGGGMMGIILPSKQSFRIFINDREITVHPK